MKKIWLIVIFTGLICEHGFCNVTFNSEPLATDIYFADLFTDSEGLAEWYQLWTGNALETGNFVDTSLFNDYGNGWVQGRDLSQLRVDFAQADDTVLWVGRWSDPNLKMTWSTGNVNFGNISKEDVTTRVTQDLPFDQMFNDMNISPGTWYRLWIGNAAGTSGDFVDTTAYYADGNGWVRAEDLGKIMFPAPEYGNSIELWVQIYTPNSGKLGWEHWPVSHTIEGNYNLSGMVIAASNTAIDNDVNDPEAPYLSNDTADDAQLLMTPITLGGYVNQPYSGNLGRSFENGDINDVYRVDLLAGDAIILSIADIFRTNLDIYLYDAATLELIDSSVAVSDIESILVNKSGAYLIQVHARRKASNYTLTIGQMNNVVQMSGLRLSSPFAPGEIIARFKENQGNTFSNQSDIFSTLGLEFRAGGGGRHRLFGMDKTKFKTKASGVMTLGSESRKILANALIEPDVEARLSTLYKIADLRDRSDVESADPNYIRYAYLVPDDEYYSFQWHYSLINLPDAWDVTIGSDDVLVAVIDTGILKNHSDIIGKTKDGYDFISSTSLSLDGDGIDPDAEDPGDQSLGGSSFHGTHVAGTIAAKTNNKTGVAGVSWNSLIMPVRVLGEGGMGFSYDIMQGVRYAAGLDNDSGVIPDQPADIINLSLGGGGYSQSEQDVFTQARNAGVIIIAAAGNSAESAPSYPAAYEGVVSVSAVNMNAGIAPYSNFGPSIDVAAPGGDFSTDLNGDGYADGVLSTAGDDSTGDIQTTYTFYQGTSMAAPHVAGVAALMKAERPGLTPEEFDGFLESGTIVSDLGSTGRDDLYGYGLIDAGKAVQAAMTGTIPTFLSVMPNSLNMGSAGETALLTLSKIGEGSLSIINIIETADWLSISQNQVDENGLGTYMITINREGLGNDIYSTSLAIVSTQNTVEVVVEMRVSSSIMLPNAGQQYILLVNYETNEVIDIISTSGENGVYYYQFTDIPAGRYNIFAGTDSDNDGYIGDAGEAIGAYISTDQPTIINLDGDRSDLNFVTEFSADILESESMKLNIPLNTRKDFKEIGLVTP
ncbi:MAG: S8 family serine peptidase [Desulfobacula sp.]|nr:S8 family serine peptidase [Desulfobacula sp.]